MKKFTALFLVFSLMIVSVNLFAKKRGVELTIIKKDGHLIRGELIAVKEHSLLLLSGTDVSIDIGDIKVIEIERKSKVGTGAILGGLVGAGLSIWAGINMEGAISDGGSGFMWAIVYGILFVPPSAGIGALIGAIVGSGKKTIQIEGMTEWEIQRTLNKLRKRARIRDHEYYPRTELKTEKKEEKVVAAELKIKVKVEEATIRLRPQTESVVVAKVPLATVFVPERKVGEWYQVSFRDERGFVLSGYIHESEVDVLKKMKKTLEIQETLDKLRKKARIRNYR